jgi:hypothetical protein
VLIALCEQDRDFLRSEYFRDRKRKIIEAYVLNFKNGKIIQNADNLVIVGSPYAMLLHSVGEDVEKDFTFTQEDGAIQCYTERFEDGEYLAEFRSPFNSKNNMGYLHNVYNDVYKKYFVFGKQIVAVNMIHTLGKHLQALHIHDNDQWHDSHQLPFTMKMDFEAIVKALDMLQSGDYTLTPQCEEGVQVVRKIHKEHAKIDFSLSAKEIVDLVRGMNPAPVAYTAIGENKINVYLAEKADLTQEESELCAAAQIGEVLSDKPKRGLIVKCGDGTVRLLEVQGAGGKRMGGGDFLNGRKAQKGQVLSC